MTTTFEQMEDDRIRATKPGPDIVEMFTVEDLQRRHMNALEMIEEARTAANEIVDLMQAVNDSKDIAVTIDDIPDKL